METRVTHPLPLGLVHPDRAQRAAATPAAQRRPVAGRPGPSAGPAQPGARGQGSPGAGPPPSGSARIHPGQRRPFPPRERERGGKAAASLGSHAGLAARGARRPTGAAGRTCRGPRAAHSSLRAPVGTGAPRPGHPGHSPPRGSALGAQRSTGAFRAQPPGGRGLSPFPENCGCAQQPPLSRPWTRETPRFSGGARDPRRPRGPGWR